MPPRHPDQPPQTQLPGTEHLPMVLCNGQWLHHIEPQDFADQQAFPATEDDVAICAFPKSGTTWTNAIVEMLMRNGDPEALRHGGLLDEKSPYFELTAVPHREHWEVTSLDRLAAMKGGPRSFYTHMSYDNLPPLVKQNARILYVYRNPKDVIVSMHHFYRASVTTPYQGDLARLAEQFIEDDIPLGPYFDHIASFWSKNDTNPRMLFVSYEELSQDFKGAVEKIASFLGRRVTHEQLSTIAHECGFHTMKQNDRANKSHMSKLGVSDWNVAEFMRAGKVGSWRKEFDRATNERVDDWIAENLRRPDLQGLAFIYE